MPGFASPLPEQGGPEKDTVSALPPMHCIPPFFGKGLLQYLYRVLFPFPQSTEYVDHASQLLQFPF